MTGVVIQHVKPRKPDWFEAEVRRRVGTGFDHMMIVTEHARNRMNERDVTRRMVLRVLRRGTVDGTKMEYDAGHAHWKAPIEGISAGVIVRVICAISETNPRVVVVTVVNRGTA